MSISTEKLIPGLLPPSEPTSEKTGFLKILNDFDPKTLSEEQLTVLGKRNPFLTMSGPEDDREIYTYKGETRPIPYEPAEKRLDYARFHLNADTDDLKAKTKKYEEARKSFQIQEISKEYKKCRSALIKAIGDKACLYIVEKEVSVLSEGEKRRQQEELDRYEEYIHDGGAASYDLPFIWEPASVSEKIVKVRKGCRRLDGKAFTQKEFAKLLGVPVNKYMEAEKDDAVVTDELLEELIMICHANPYYLYDENIDADYAEYSGQAVDDGDVPAVIVGLDVIWKWIDAGKPKLTDWMQAMTDVWEFAEE